MRVPRLAGIGEFAQEALFVVVAYVAYSVARVFIEGSGATAWENAASVVALEQWLRIFNEQGVQATVNEHGWLSEAMRQMYFWGYLPFLGTAAAILYLRDRRLYRQYRNVLFVSAAVGLVCFALLPTAPPRMLPEFGFVDSLNGTPTMKSWKNEFAAIPSFHVGWTTLAAIGIAQTFRFRLAVCVAVAAVPCMMMLAVVATANHFWIDGAVGVAIVLAVRSQLVRDAGDDDGHPYGEPAPVPVRMSRDRAD